MLWDNYKTETIDSTGDRKDYADKLPYHQVKRSSFELISKVAQYGHQKYGCYDSWELQENPTVYFDAMLRHSLLEQNGEMYDQESKLLHIAHGLWNYQAWCYLLLRENNLIDEDGNILLAQKHYDEHQLRTVEEEITTFKETQLTIEHYKPEVSK